MSNAPKSTEFSSTQSALIDVGKVAMLCGCSRRHIRRLSDCGRMPSPLRLGSILRWRRDEIMKWIRAGCPSCRTGKGGGK